MKDVAGAASPNGLKALDQAWNLLSATIGKVVLPGFVLLASSVMATADMLNEDMKKAGDGIADAWIALIPGFVVFTTNLYLASKAAADFAQWVITHADKGSSFAGGVSKGMTGSMSSLAMIGNPLALVKMAMDGMKGVEEGEKEKAAGGGNAAPAMDKYVLGKMRDGMSAMIAGMKHDMGMPASFSGSAMEVWKRATIGASEPPTEAKTRQRHAEMMGILDKVFDALQDLAK